MAQQPGKCLGTGGTASVYEWGDSEAVKVFHPHVPDESIEYEVSIASRLMGLPVKAAHFRRTVTLYGRTAIVYARAHGNSMSEALFRGQDMEGLAHDFASLHAEIHRVTANGLFPPLHERLARKIASARIVLGSKADQAIRLLAEIPEGGSLCHSDFHPLNILVDGGKYTVIDWNDCCAGNPAIDAAWAVLILRSPAIGQAFGEQAERMARAFSSRYLEHYEALTGITGEQVLACLPVLAARRAADNASGASAYKEIEAAWLMDLINGND